LEEVSWIRDFVLNVFTSPVFWMVNITLCNIRLFEVFKGFMIIEFDKWLHSSVHCPLDNVLWDLYYTKMNCNLVSVQRFVYYWSVHSDIFWGKIILFPTKSENVAKLKKNLFSQNKLTSICKCCYLSFSNDFHHSKSLLFFFIAQSLTIVVKAREFKRENLPYHNRNPTQTRRADDLSDKVIADTKGGSV
jgi:hypothetical protein